MTGLVGRDGVLRLLESFVAATATGGAALLVAGDRGVGTSALLDAAELSAWQHGHRVLRTDAGDQRASAPLSSLAPVLDALRDHRDALTSDQRLALAVARRHWDGRPPDRTALDPVRVLLGSAPVALLGSALRSLLASAAAVGPVVVVVDDADGLDRTSGDVLAFVTRRLTGTRANLLAATRPGRGPLADAGLRQVDVGPLTDAEARRLLAARRPGLPAWVRDRVVTEAAGNPLALLELPRGLTTEELAGSRLLPAPLPVHGRLVGVFGPRIAALPARTRDTLLLAALDGTGDWGPVQAADAGAAAHLAPAEDAGLVRVDETHGRLRFLHPLVPATVVALAGDAGRRRAHHRLSAASVRDEHRRLWHLALATDRPDERVAALLEQDAQHSLRRGDARDAGARLQRAAELSPAAADRARRQVLAAIVGADVAGDLGAAARLLAEAERLEPALTSSLPAAVAASRVLLDADCDVDAAHRVLRDAIEARPSQDDPTDPVVEQALHGLLVTGWLGGRAELWEPLRRAATRPGPGLPALVDLCHRALGDPAGQAAVALPVLDALLERVDVEVDPSRVTRLALACVYTDRLGECRQALSRVVDGGRRGGAVALTMQALVAGCLDDWMTGQWDEAVDRVAEGVRLSDAHGYRRHAVVLGSYVGPLVAVARGDLDRARAAADDLSAAAARGMGLATVLAAHLRTLRAVALGDFADAFAHASAISPPGTIAPYQPHALWVLLDLVESAVRTGRRDAADAHVAELRRRGVDRISPRLHMVTAGCAAIAATAGPDPDAAMALFEEAVTAPDGDRWPFDHARIQLAYGEHLRHLGRLDAARHHLGDALADLRRLGAGPWTGRASAGLRAAGVQPPTAPRATGTLTAREREVAELAARGLTNRQIGEVLYLSPRSVGAVLYRVFPKLGTTSRAALAAALERVPAG